MSNKFTNIKKFSIVKDNTNLIRDNESKAIINTNESQREEYRKRRRLLKERMIEIKEINKEQQDKIVSLEKELKSLKTLVTKFLEN